MKKILLIASFIVLISAGFYYLFAIRLDYNKIILVLPSSSRASSPYFYKKDGDFFLASDLKQGLEDIGYKVQYRYREDYNDLRLKNAGNIIYFKGYYNYEKLPAIKTDKRKRILYLYYIEGLHTEILHEVDAVACASQKLIDGFIAPSNIKAYYVPQFTNPKRFRTPLKEKDKAYPVLFVGSNHTKNIRQSVDYALNAKADLSVFGKFWERLIPPQNLKGKYIDNDELYKYYGNADIVLNDHRNDMKYYGFISNRIYDVTASGGFVLTDYLPEIEKIYGDSIVMYKSFNDFQEKLDYFLNHPEERRAKALSAQKITLENFTNDKIAKLFDRILKNIKK